MNYILKIASGLLVLGLCVSLLGQKMVQSSIKSKRGSDQESPQTAVQKNTPPPLKRLSLSNEVRLKADERGHYIADFKMNGRLVKALVDTGASSVAINRTMARQLGINVTLNDFIHEANTANGKAKMATALVKDIRIGKILVRDVEVAILEDKALSGALLGMSFLNQLKSFRVEDGELVLEQ